MGNSSMRIMLHIFSCSLFHVLGSISVLDAMNYVGGSWVQPGYQVILYHQYEGQLLAPLLSRCIGDGLMIGRFVNMDRCQLNGMRSASTENWDGIVLTY